MIKIDPEKKYLRIEAGEKSVVKETEAVIRALIESAEAGMTEVQKRDFWKRVKAELKPKKRG